MKAVKKPLVFCVCILLICTVPHILHAEKPAAKAEVEKLGHGYERRGNEIHFMGGTKTGEGKDATRIDRPSKRVIDGFSRALGDKVRPIQNLDVASFEALSVEYTRDKNMVYYKWISPGVFLVIELPQADVKTFRALGFNLAKDKNRVWYYGAVVPGADGATAKLIDDTHHVWKDASTVWYQRTKIKGADTKTFRHLGSAYYADANTVYWCYTPIADADPKTIKVLGGSFVAADKNTVYRSGVRLANIDPATCKFILHAPYGYQVISDKNGVYLNDLKFLHADPKTFKMIDKRKGRGGKYMFLVDTWHCTPVTLYKKGGLLISETILYDQKTRAPLAVVKANVAGGKMRNITLSPAPGEKIAQAVPQWQMNIFNRDGLAEEIEEAGRLLK